jgi:hypothetical protein
LLPSSLAHHVLLAGTGVETFMAFVAFFLGNGIIAYLKHFFVHNMEIKLQYNFSILISLLYLDINTSLSSVS